MTHEHAAHSSRRLGARLSGVVLAAGRAERMGEPKQLLELGDKILVQHVIDAALAARLDELILVLGHAAERIGEALRADTRARIRTARTRDAEAGPGHSLATGLGACAPETDAAVVLLGDQPGVSTELIDRVCDAFRASHAKALRPVWRDASGASTPGHPVVLGRALWPALAGAADDSGAGPLLDAHPEWLETLEIAGTPPADIDTWEDYRRAGGAARVGRAALEGERRK